MGEKVWGREVAAKALHYVNHERYATVKKWCAKVKKVKNMKISFGVEVKYSYAKEGICGRIYHEWVLK